MFSHVYKNLQVHGNLLYQRTSRVSETTEQLKRENMYGVFEENLFGELLLPFPPTVSASCVRHFSSGIRIPPVRFTIFNFQTTDVGFYSKKTNPVVFNISQLAIILCNSSLITDDRMQDYSFIDSRLKWHCKYTVDSSHPKNEFVPVHIYVFRCVIHWYFPRTST